jgi:gamma-glutamyl-gamma-aminobutyrate hydrolase PuuD
LIVAAKSEDGIIEAYEDKSGRVLGVQWHPELSKAKSDFEVFKWLIEQ